MKQKNLIVHKAAGLKYKVRPGIEWTERDGEMQLTDGVLGYTKTLREFVGFIQDSTQIELNWNESDELSHISLNFLNSPLNDIYLPARIVVEASYDGINYTPVSGLDMTNQEYTLNCEIHPVTIPLVEKEYKAIRLMLTMRDSFKGNLLGKNKPENALDEIVVE